MASQKGGRSDLQADSRTIDMAVTVQGFRSFFEGGREGHEGYYAFQNEMTSRTSEYDEIVFNLQVLVRATERLVDNGTVDDERTYDLFVRLGTTVERIERNGPGYDESKLLCSFIWEIFAGWNFVDGDLGAPRLTSREALEAAVGEMREGRSWSDDRLLGHVSDVLVERMLT